MELKKYTTIATIGLIAGYLGGYIQDYLKINQTQSTIFDTENKTTRI
ncbi:MAG: hypothetical protein mread185_000577 [Mycoplasmataceae bacterium]|nr:MAG: hypothetical protein mread185_000577 [Mycoplasmataceae bacterium]